MLKWNKSYIASLPLCSEPDWWIPLYNGLWFTWKVRFILCGSVRLLKSEEVPVHSSEWLMSLQQTAFHCCALLLCHWLACQAVWIKLELSRFSWNSLHFPTHYVICHSQCCLTGSLCKSCQSILLPSLLITTCNLYLNDIFTQKWTQIKQKRRYTRQRLTAQQLIKESIPAKGRREVL